MPQTEESTENFSAWRIWILKTLDRLANDVEELKTLTNDRGEYLRRFEVVEKELKELTAHIASLNVATAVSNRTLVIWGSIAAFIGAGITALAGKLL